MTDIKYYPLVDADTDGTIKTPMFFTDKEETVTTYHRMYLEELMPHYFRLCTSKPVKTESVAGLDIRCPYCGKTLRSITNPKDGTKHMLMSCDRCS